MPHIAVIGNNGGSSSEHLADCVARATGKRVLVDMENIWLDLNQGKVWHEGTDLTRLDAVIIKKVGPSYSPHLLDRLSCTVTLRMAGIPMPPTTITENTEQAVKIIETYQEAVLKPLFSSKARGMWVLKYGKDTFITVEDFKRNNPILYIQKKMNLPQRDLGIVFLGGEYLTTYARYSDGISWNTSTESGGRYAACDPSPETIEIAGKAQALFDLDFTIVDVVETPDGPLVFEVSAFGGFKGMKTARNMDGAAYYVDYVLRRLSSGHADIRKNNI